ncbi:MAG TPA: hypothetical protein VK473_02240 [Terriglobales bacterium]|nr:hypothetical protein [Terriglobales bacterium]
MKRVNMKSSFFFGLLLLASLTAAVAAHAQGVNADPTLLVATPISGSQFLLRCDAVDSQHLACESVSGGGTAVVSRETCTSYPEYQCEQDYANPQPGKGKKLSANSPAAATQQTGDFSTSSGGPELFLSY